MEQQSQTQQLLLIYFAFQFKFSMPLLKYVMHSFLLPALLLVVLCNPKLHAQSLGIDIQQDWFAEVPHIEFGRLDTIMLYPLKGNINNNKDVLVWHYLGAMQYQLKVHNNTNATLVNAPYTYAPEQWTLIKKHDGNWYLQAKEMKDPRPFHKKLCLYQLQLYRNDHGILYKMLLLKQYNARHSHSLSPATLLN